MPITPCRQAPAPNPTGRADASLLRTWMLAKFAFGLSVRSRSRSRWPAASSRCAASWSALTLVLAPGSYSPSRPARLPRRARLAVRSRSRRPPWQPQHGAGRLAPPPRCRVFKRPQRLAAALGHARLSPPSHAPNSSFLALRTAPVLPLPPCTCDRFTQCLSG